ncbi:hypothetical protein [uncultured Marivita sp.]|uniref:hypothetical protein n=1 Tax=uncultured Marivita sp. TaxID=888080 RepID=UPI002633A784|nr:hypothetical protein [uncultured Marivita sp.]
MDDIQKSEIVISKILGLLMEWGIQECDLEFDELELDESYRPFFFACISWLENEGVIRTDEVVRTLDNVAAGVVIRPVLTSYGMRIMEAEVDLPGVPSQPVSKAVQEVQSGNAQYAKAGNFTGGLLASFIKSLG